jgi:hypothetical protein
MASSLRILAHGATWAAWFPIAGTSLEQISIVATPGVHLTFNLELF